MDRDKPFLELPVSIDAHALWNFSNSLVWHPHAIQAKTAFLPQEKFPEFFDFSFPPNHRKDSFGSYFLKLPPRSDYTWHTDRYSTAVIIGPISPPLPGQRLQFKVKGEVKTFSYAPNRLYLMDVKTPHQSINDSDHERVIWKLSWSNKEAFRLLREHFFPEYRRSSVRRFMDRLRHSFRPLV